MTLRIGVSVGARAWTPLGLYQRVYLDALRGLRVEPVVLRPNNTDPDALLDTLDGLVLGGGGDVAVARSGAAWARDVDPARDALEVALTEGALRRDLPLLAICRGLQVLNVTLGGTLRGLDGAARARHGWAWTGHAIRVAAESPLASLPGRRVTSFHAQAIDRLADGLKVAAWHDQTLEAVFVPEARWALGVQWHPELLGAARLSRGARALFRRFVEVVRG